jgi:hypothetical protein
MPCLTNLKVKKVSFVRRGANKREFFLAKSADFVEGEAGDGEGAVEVEVEVEEKEVDVNKNKNSNNNHGGAYMRPEVRLKLGEILKKERNVEQVCALLKEDTVLKATDAEVGEVRDFVALIPAPDQTAQLELIKSQDALAKETLAKANAEKELQAIRESNHKAEIRKWVDAKCGYLAGISAEEATEQILKAEKVDPVTAEILKKSFESTSTALKASEVVKEIGRGGEDFDPISGGIVAEVSKVANELKKSSDVIKASDSVMAAIRSVGGKRYEAYRKDFNHRVRTL